MGRKLNVRPCLSLKQVVERCDFLIDYHGGDLDESLRPYAYWAPTGKEAQDHISKEMVLAFGLDHIIIWRDRPTDLGATRYLDNTSTARGATLPSSSKLAMPASSKRMTSTSSSRGHSAPCALSKCFQGTPGPSRIRSGSTGSWMSCPRALAFGTRL